jgi:hypothetical protein
VVPVAFVAVFAATAFGQRIAVLTPDGSPKARLSPSSWFERSNQNSASLTPESQDRPLIP